MNNCRILTNLDLRTFGDWKKQNIFSQMVVTNGDESHGIMGI